MPVRAPGASIVHELSVLQERLGWLPPEALRELSRRLAVPLHRLESVSTFYPHFRRSAPKRFALAVCRDLPCWLAGGVEACAGWRRELGARDDLELREVSCLGRCDRAPAARIGERVVSLDRPAAVRSALAAAPPVDDSALEPGGPWAADPYADEGEHGSTLRAWLAREPAEAIGELQAAGLRGMGGAGFPTGRKWALVASQPTTPRYVICNADESEPGAFKDRQLLTDLPHLVVEGLALAALAVGAERGWVFVRHEYAPERRRLERAIQAARARGALGERIFGSAFGFDVEVFVSPGGYVLGEETALLECMEDRRGEPRNRPPFPGVRGLRGAPTLVQNVETLVHAVSILRRGAAWWASLGRPGFRGHKFVSVSGDIVRPGVELVAMGTPLGELLERRGGVRGGGRVGAVAPGGASSPFLGGDRLDTPLDFDALARAGSGLGAGAVIVVGPQRDLLEVALNVTRFFRNESCGKCVPCRLGCEQAVRLVERREHEPEALRGLLEELHATLSRTSICGLGQVALAPLLSVLRRGAPGGETAR